MNIQFIEPLSRAFERMKRALFQPFDLKKWLVVGFTAWLAGLLDGSGSGGGKTDLSDVDNIGNALDAPYQAWNWLQDHPQWWIAIGFGLAFTFFLLAVFTWLSSRGKFMFVDNIVHDRALVAKPWNEYSKEGDSLFLWRFIFTLVCIAAVLGFLYQAWRSAYALYFASYDESIPWTFVIRMIFLFLLLVSVLGYINLLLNEFVSAIMYRQRIPAVQAWNLLLDIHRPHFLQFIAFAVLWLFLKIFTAVLVAIVALLTCCTGFILLLLPYINAVVLLPISYTFRAYSLEFLAQFGDDYSVFTGQNEDIYPTAVG